MLQNSFMKKIQIRCPQHPNRTIRSMCLQQECCQNPLVCEECLGSYNYKKRHYSHQLQIKSFQEGIQYLASRIKYNSQAATQIYANLNREKQIQQLLKWQEEREQHLLSIKNNINSVKFQIEQEIDNIIMRFQKELHAQKDIIYSRLEKFYQNYKQKFEKFVKATQPIVSMNKVYKFYPSKCSILLKLLHESAPAEWLADLKRTLKYCERISVDPHQANQQVRRLSIVTNQIMDQLPSVRNADYELELPDLLANSAEGILRAYVKLHQHKNISRSISLNTMSHDQKWVSNNQL